MEPTACDSRRPKHIEIDDAIAQLQHVSVEAEDLFRKVTGEETFLDKPMAEPPSSQPPTLQDIVNGSSARISDISQSIRVTLNKINDVLF